MFIFTIFYTIVYIYKACVVSSTDHLQLGLAVLAHLKRSYEPVKSEISLRAGGSSPRQAGLLSYECNFKNISRL